MRKGRYNKKKIHKRFFPDFHSSCRAVSTDFPDPRMPPISIIHRSQWVFQASSCCLQILPGRPDFARPCEVIDWSISLMCSSLLLQQYPICLVLLTRGPKQYITYVFVLTSPAVSHMSGSYNKRSTAVYRLWVRP